MKSIRTRLILCFMLVVVTAVVILEILLTNTVSQNYYKSLEDSLISQARISSEAYQRYFSDSTIYENVLNDVDAFWIQAKLQVEILDPSGKVLMDSIGNMPKKPLESQDVKAAVSGSPGVWTGNVDYDKDAVMAVSYPLKSGNKIVGVLRLVSSLRNVNSELDGIFYMFILIGVAVVFISAVISILLAESMVRPLREVKKTAEEMAGGNFHVTANKIYDDEIGKLSDTLNFMASEIIKKDQIKNDFVMSVSHELRTPLTSIKGWAVTLKSGSPEEKELMMDGLDIIEQECDRLTEMVEELLDFSKFVSGKIAIKREKVDLFSVVEQIKLQLMPRASREGIDFTVSCQEGIQDFYSDENRLKQVFINILDNAFKFTPESGSISFTVVREGDLIVCSIIDTGCGIQNYELPRVKERFYKGRTSNSKNGIGLSICDEIIKLMNGQFDIESNAGQGTEVKITLPLSYGV